MRAHRRWNRIGKIGIQILERPSNNAPKPARRELALSGRFVDWNNPSNFERSACLLFGLIGSAFFVDVAKNLKLRLNNLQVPVAVLFDLAIKRHHLPRLESGPEDKWR